MDRRTFLSTAGAGVLAVSPARAASAPPLLRGGRFSEGVLSGDPTPTGITLATRLAGVEGRGSVLVEIARDAGFNRVVSRGRLLTGPGLGHAVKARVAGLRPHTRYWYRFSGRTADSSVGQFRTASPAGSHQPVQFGIVYGIDFAAGYFNALTLLAKEDVDFVLNLGTYIDSDPQAGTARPPYDVPAARSLPGYRLRYRSARADPGLRALHADHALVSTWDDGEVASDYVGRDSAQSLKSAAYRAWFESMPHYPAAPAMRGSTIALGSVDSSSCTSATRVNIVRKHPPWVSPTCWERLRVALSAEDSVVHGHVEAACDPGSGGRARRF